MSRALIVTIQENASVQQDKRIYWDAWYVCAQRWLDYFDHVYVLGDAWGTDGIVLPLKFELRPGYGAWDELSRNMLAQTIRDVKDDIVLVMDSDVLFYSREEMRDILRTFSGADYDFGAILDYVGDYRHRHQVSREYPEFSANWMRAERNTIAPYMFLAKTGFIRNTELDFSPRLITNILNGDNVWWDGFVCWPREIMSMKPKFFELRDVRHSLFMSDTGVLTWDSNLDGHPYAWSVDGYYDIGYYRLRSRPIDDTDTFEEALRNMAWHWILSCAFADNLDWQDWSTNKLSDYEVDMDDWLDYVEIMRAYYSWVEEL